MYLTYNEGNSVVAERFIKNLKNKVYKRVTAVSKKNYFDVLDDFVENYYNTFHRTIGIKSIDDSYSDSYSEYNVDFHEKDPKFKVGDHVRILEYKKIFAKGYTPNWSEENFVISKIKNTVPLMLLMI